MTKQRFWITCLALSAFSVYLFATAPPPLEDKKAAGATIPVERMFEILKAENDAVRAMWTKDIVGAGKLAGLKFDEHWREADVEAGPLPALFLRETAKSLEKNPTPLQALKQTHQPQFFYLADIQMQVAMFPDLAVSDGCVLCHNNHNQSPKHDWKLNDVMGATTWMYPAATVTMDELIRTIAALHQGFQDAYSGYIEKARKFANPPALGERWPSEGYSLPLPDVFLQEIIKRAAPHTLARLTALADKPLKNPAKLLEARHVDAH